MTKENFLSQFNCEIFLTEEQEQIIENQKPMIFFGIEVYNLLNKLIAKVEGRYFAKI